MTGQSEGLAEEVRDQIRLALRITGISQAELGRRLGISPKHISQMLTGRVAVSLDMAERMLTEIGWELEVFSRPHVQVTQTADSAPLGREPEGGLLVQCTAHSGPPVAMVHEDGMWRCPAWGSDDDPPGHVRWVSDREAAEVAAGRKCFWKVVVTEP